MGGVSVFLAFFLVVPSFSARQDHESSPAQTLRPAPDFKLTDTEGRPITLTGASGKVVLLNFFASWCGPCREEIPDLIALQTKYKGRLQVIGLLIDDDDGVAAQKIVKETGINYPVARAPNDLRDQYGCAAVVPTSFIIDTERRVVQKHVGTRDLVLYESEIRALLGLPVAKNLVTQQVKWGMARPAHQQAPAS